MPLTPPITVVYDGECFFCANYIRLLRLRETGGVELVNARDRDKVTALHLDPVRLNEGMMVIIGEERYFGADAIHRLTFLTTPSSAFNRLNRLVFRSHALARLLYPLLKLGRRTYLALAGKGLIH